MSTLAAQTCGTGITQADYRRAIQDKLEIDWMCGDWVSRATIPTASPAVSPHTSATSPLSSTTVSTPQVLTSFASPILFATSPTVLSSTLPVPQLSPTGPIPELPSALPVPELSPTISSTVFSIPIPDLHSPVSSDPQQLSSPASPDVNQLPDRPVHSFQSLLK